MKIAIVTESFLPQVNGVVNTVLRILEELEPLGHEALVIAPDDPAGVPDRVHGAAVVTMPSWSLPSHPEVRVASGRVSPVAARLAEFEPDVVHLASPFELGWRGARAAERLGLPLVATFQTDVPAFAAGHGYAWLEPQLRKRVRRIHGLADRTLVPSSASLRQLQDEGIERLAVWGRGVDAVRFHPDRHSEAWRQRVGTGRPLVGFVGRLAPEKQVHRLLTLRDEQIDLVVIGDGPSRGQLERLLPDAHFTGMLHGDDLAVAMASLDLLVHTGDHETFCQVIQEAMASAVPVVAPASGGPLDLVDHSRTGWLFTNPEDMRLRVRDLIGDDYKRWVMGSTARRTVEDRTWAALVTELLGHWTAAIGTPVAAGDFDKLNHRGSGRAG